jgi:glucose-1-phosphate adenylyltransferase
MVLGGGPGNELRPLTDVRAEPAMPFAGSFRLIDIPLSNCINSGGRDGLEGGVGGGVRGLGVGRA